MRVRWQDILRATPEARRPLTAYELARLRALGFTALAQALAAGTCPDCHGNLSGRMHADLCEPRNPLPAPKPAAQPWQPRPSRRLRDAA